MKLVQPGVVQTPSLPSATGSVGAGASIARASLSGLAAAARAAVASVRQSFTAGIAPPAVVSSGSSISSYISTFAPASSSQAIVMSTARLGLSSSPVGSSAPPPRPELDRLEISSDRTVGILDSFYVRAVLSVRTIDLDGIDYLQLFRADLGPVPGVNPPGASALSQTVPDRSTRKNIDPISISVFRSSAVGGSNGVSSMIGLDPQTGARVAQSSGSTALAIPLSNTNSSRPAGRGQLLTIANVDQSILNPLPRTRIRGVGSNAFFITQRALNGPMSASIPVTTGQRSGINVLQGGALSAGTVVQGSNASGYGIVASISAASARGRAVGGFTEFSFSDPSVVYGRKYSYFVIAVDPSGSSSVRSRMINVDVVSLVPPGTPDLSFTVAPGLRNDLAPHPRFTLICSSSFPDHVEVYRRGGVPPSGVLVLNTTSSLLWTMPSRMIPNGFYHIGDYAYGIDGSTTIVDFGAVPGQDLEYRFYSVDSFGMKSQTPASCSLVLPETGGRIIPLQIPTITAEQSPSGRATDIRVISDDPRSVAILLTRTISSQGESLFHLPNDPAGVRVGNGVSGKRSRSRVYPMMFGPAQWIGFLPLVSGSAQLLDQAVDYDRGYQYAAVAVGSWGQRSSPGISETVFIRTKPVIDPPSDVRATVVSVDGVPTGIRVEWSGSTLDFGPAQLIGSQDDLSDTSLRTVYQVERRLTSGRLGSWSPLPATTATFYVDPVSTGDPPPFRPKFALPMAEYDYRVIAMQSGGFISGRSPSVRITSEPPIPPPDTIWARSTSLAVRPLAVVVSWPTPREPIDLWQVERAAVNKIYGWKISTVGSPVVQGLPYVRVAEIPIESSKALQIASDMLPSGTNIFVGDRYYIDGDVDPANSYFYRIRAVLRTGTASDWNYTGIVLNDSAHDRKLFSTVSDSEKSALALDPRPISSTGIE